MLPRIQKELQNLQLQKLIPESAASLRLGGGLIQHRGKKLIDFTSWDYFGLAQSRKIIGIAQKELERHGLGSTSSRFLSGASESLLHAERALAKFTVQDSAVILSSRNQAFFTLLTGIVQEGDTVIVQEGTESPAIDVALLVGANVVIFHLGSLSRTLENIPREQGQSVFLICESLSSLTGEIADLASISLMTSQAGVRLIVDESSAIGALGQRGGGGADHFTVFDRVFAVVGSLSHSLCASGGFISGSAELISYLVSRSRTLALEPPIPSALCSVIGPVIDEIEIAHLKRDQLGRLARKLSAHLVQMGFTPLSSDGSPLISLPFLRLSTVREISQFLLSRGFLVDASTLREERSERAVLRMIVTIQHLESQIDTLLASLHEALPKASRLESKL